MREYALLLIIFEKKNKLSKIIFNICKNWQKSRGTRTRPLEKKSAKQAKTKSMTKVFVINDRSIIKKTATFVIKKSSLIYTIDIFIIHIYLFF